MQFIGFSTLAAASAYKQEHGGWVFVSNACVRIVWFPPTTTPSQIISHDVTKGFSGAIF